MKGPSILCKDVVAPVLGGTAGQTSRARPVEGRSGPARNGADVEIAANAGIGARFLQKLQSRLYARLKDQYTASESCIGHCPGQWRKTTKEAA